MKTQISKPTRERTRYTEEYKQEALALWRNSGRSAAKVAAELGLRPPLLYRWARLERLPEAQERTQATAQPGRTGEGEPAPEAIFKLATGFMHPRRVEVFRALTNGADSFAKLQAATNLPVRALSHLAKLEARGFVKSEVELYVATVQRHPFGRVLARLARS